jgi:hypothetical protein
VVEVGVLRVSSLVSFSNRAALVLSSGLLRPSRGCFEVVLRSRVHSGLQWRMSLAFSLALAILTHTESNAAERCIFRQYLRGHGCWLVDV